MAGRHLRQTGRHRLHAAACRRVAAGLRSRGHTAEAAGASGHDLVVDGRWGVNVRAARVHLRHHVTRWHGRPYRYDYRQLGFNLHRHGVPCAFADWWVLVDATHHTCWIVPGDAMAGRYTVHVAVGRRRNRVPAIFVAPYREAWEGLAA
jgi:hypothetical protein